MENLCLKSKRKVDVVVISDVHLGTYGCQAKELLCYLKSIQPKVVVLNGDIIDIWQFSKRYWPKTHMQVIRYLMRLIGKGIKVYYIPGNHDETMRRFVGFKLGSFSIVNKVVLELKGGAKAWFFHGDVFDVTMQYSKWLARLGAVGYDLLIHLNRFANFINVSILKKGRISFSKSVKNKVKSAVKFINCFEETAASIGISNGYDYVVCGHIHQPEIRNISNSKGSITYLNSGDWVENLTALEFFNGRWSLYHFQEEHFLEPAIAENDTDDEPDNQQLFSQLLDEFNLMKII